MNSRSIPQTHDPRSNPVEGRYARLSAGVPYTRRCRPEEWEKVKGSEPTWAREQATKDVTVFVWLTASQWERLHTTHAVKAVA